MRKLIVMFSLLAVLTPVSVLASIYGVLAGKVVDTDGKGVIGATVLVEGTTRGTNVRARDGSFTVTNITAGNYTVRVRSIGKQEYKVNVRISVDQTTNINVTLKDDAVMMDSVVVVAEQGTPKKVDETNIGAITTMSNEELTRQSGSNLASVIGLSAGVSSGSEGFAIRGSRSSETQIRVNGLNVGNQFTGGFGSGGQAYFPMISTYATEEVQVITGNFAAQYGDAQGGVVNAVARTGRTDKFDGYIRWQTDLGFLAGSQSDGVEVVEEDGIFRLKNGGKGLDYLMGNYNDIDFGIGGPIPFINDRTTFFVTAYNRTTENYYGYDLKDPLGNSLVEYPYDGNLRTGRNILGNIKFGITNDISLLLSASYGFSAGQDMNYGNLAYGWLYSSEIGTPYRNSSSGDIDPYGEPVSNGISQRDAKTIAENQFISTLMARINHTLTDRSFYEVTFSRTENNDERGRKVTGSDLGFFTGFDIMMPEDNWIVDGDRWIPAVDNNGKVVGDKVVDWASPVTYTGYSKDGYCNSSWSGINPLTGYYEGQPYSSGTNNPWGIQGINYQGGSQGFDFRYGEILEAQGNYNLYGLMTGDFKHIIKAGFEVNYLTSDRHYNSQPYSGNPVYDIYTAKWGGNIYADSAKTYDKTSKAFNQLKIGLYVQDQITYKGIVFNPGIRLDVMDPMSEYRVMKAEAPQFIPISSDSGFADASVKLKVSPRISINYPITERSYISMSYGQFFQSPYATYLFDRFNSETIQSGAVIGDPNMEAQQTTQYQVSYQNQLTDELAMSLSVYYKDIYNQLGLTQIMTAPEAYLQWAVSEYGSSKGIEASFTKYMSNYFAFGLNYALAYVTVTSSEASSNLNVIEDPYTKVLAFPLAPFYSSSDVRHMVKGYLAFQMRRDEGPSLWGFKPLQNTMLNIQPMWRSGTPYTRTNATGMDISEKNAYRYPSYWNVSLNLSKAFYLKDWFGESMKNAQIEFFVQVNNLFNRRAAIQVYRTSGDPLDNGLGLNTVSLGDFSSTPWYATADYANPTSFSKEQYDVYGNRLYNAASDFDQNGMVTQDEKLAAYRKYYENAMQSRPYFQTPITVQAGIHFKF